MATITTEVFVAIIGGGMVVVSLIGLAALWIWDRWREKH